MWQLRVITKDYLLAHGPAAYSHAGVRQHHDEVQRNAHKHQSYYDVLLFTE